MTTAPSGRGAPLARLFAIAYKQLIDGLHERLEERGWSGLRAGFGFVLLAVRDHAMTVTELAEVLGVTKQAASKVIDLMTADGYVRRRVGKDDARQRDIALTSRGTKLLSEVERIYVELEAEWAAVIGVKALEQMRKSLTLAVSRGGDEQLPVVRPTADQTGGLTAAVRKSR